MREDGAEETGGGAKKRDLKIGQKFCVWTPVKSRWGVRFFLKVWCLKIPLFTDVFENLM